MGGGFAGEGAFERAAGAGAGLPSTCAVVVAGGTGSRFGDARGKQFVELAGRPMLAWSLLAFDAVACVRRIVVVLPPDKIDQVAREIIAPLKLRADIWCVPGGETRQDSVRSGLAGAGECELTAIHDAARPLVTPEAIARALAPVASGEADCALLAAPVADTLKRADDQGFVAATVPRENLWAAQTPQVMRTGLAQELHARAQAEGLVVTDDAALAEHYGHTVRLIDPQAANFKVTLAHDLPLAETILRIRQHQ